MTTTSVAVARFANVAIRVSDGEPRFMRFSSAHLNTEALAMHMTRRGHIRRRLAPRGHRSVHRQSPCRRGDGHPAGALTGDKLHAFRCVSKRSRETTLTYSKTWLGWLHLPARARMT